ncbi:uncharacterized protein LOC116009958 [Ipomoea triloba]|uniref:uncharacterized protein LOC116009958 n=1 Tax=Ipomoea triloba TaxID=35885 RepID=UPI00125E5FF4|nr:uncharacterized protein LOC116009958 [Ipomoea triloba]
MSQQCFSSSNSSSDSDDDEDDYAAILMIIAACVLMDDIERTPCRTSILSGSIDGTHLVAWAPASKQTTFRGRKGGMVTQNVMAVCSHDMMFTFVYAGWEGSANDSRIFLDALSKPEIRFPMPPEGHYYVVDGGYPNARFPILKFINAYPLVRQSQIPIACCALHNFIRLKDMDDQLASMYAMQDMILDDDGGSTSGVGNDIIQLDMSQQHQMLQVREDIANAIWANYNH